MSELMLCEIESPTLDDLDDEMKMLLAAWWAVSDAETPPKHEVRPLLHYQDVLAELAGYSAARASRVKSPVDKGTGTGLPSHRKVRARAA